jgi:hypothetical protein
VFRRRVSILAITAVAACGSAVAPAANANKTETPESLSASIDVSTSIDGLAFPTLHMSITVFGTSTRGLPVTVSALTVDGTPATSPVTMNEGSHTICATVRSSSLLTASTCRAENPTWPRFQGRVIDGAGVCGGSRCAWTVGTLDQVLLQRSVKHGDASSREARGIIPFATEQASPPASVSAATSHPAAP